MSLVFPLLLLSLSPNPAARPPGFDGTALVWAKAGPLTSQGSGVLLDKQQRLLVTAWHVVRDEIKYRFPDTTGKSRPRCPNSSGSKQSVQFVYEYKADLSASKGTVV